MKNSHLNRTGFPLYRGTVGKSHGRGGMPASATVPYLDTAQAYLNLFEEVFTDFHRKP
jgi:hypothetical protein